MPLYKKELQKYNTSLIDSLNLFCEKLAGFEIIYYLCRVDANVNSEFVV